MVNGKQCMVLWHVDNLKISHVNSSVVDKVITKLEQEFGKEAPITKNEGRQLKYLGMILDYQFRVN